MFVNELDGFVEIGFLILSALHEKVPVGLASFLNLTTMLLPLMVHSISMNPSFPVQSRSSLFGGAYNSGGNLKLSLSPLYRGIMLCMENSYLLISPLVTLLCLALKEPSSPGMVIAVF